MDTHQLDFCVQPERKLTNPTPPPHPPLTCDSRYNCDPDDSAVFPSNKVGHAANNPRKRRLALMSWKRMQIKRKTENEEKDNFPLELHWHKTTSLCKTLQVQLSLLQSLPHAPKD